MGRWRVVSHSGGHGDGIRAEGDSRAEGGHEIGGVVGTPQIGRLHIEQELFPMKDFGSVSKGQVSSWIGHTEGDWARLERGKLRPMLHDRPILCGLVQEDPQLSIPVFRHRGITVEMVRTEIEPECDLGPEGTDCFQLKRTDLRNVQTGFFPEQ